MNSDILKISQELPDINKGFETLDKVKKDVVHDSNKNTNNKQTGTALDKSFDDKSNTTFRSNKVNTSNFADIKKMQSDINNLISLIEKKPNIMSVVRSQSSNDIIFDNIKSDGKWGTRTNEQLNNIYYFAGALLNTNAYYKLGVTGYDIKDFNNFRTLISGYKLGNNGLNSEKIDRQSQRAKIISTHINALILFFNDIILKVESDNRIKPDDDLLDVYNERPPNLTDEEKQLIDERGEYTFSINVEYDGKQSTIPVPLAALQTPKEFETWFNTSRYQDVLKPYGDAKTFFNDVIKKDKWV